MQELALFQSSGLWTWNSGCQARQQMLFLSECSGQANVTFIGLLTPIRKYIVAILAVNIGSLSSAVFRFGLCVEGVFQAFKSFKSFKILLEKRKTLGLPLASHLPCQWVKGPVLTTL